MKTIELSNKRLTQKGFSLVELVIVIALMGLLMLAVINFGSTTIDGGKVGKALDQVRQIAAAAISWQSGRFNYNGITLNALETERYLPAGFGALGNPFGGAYTVTGAGNRFTITVSNFPDNGLCLQALNKIRNDTIVAPTCAGTTLSATFGG